MRPSRACRACAASWAGRAWSAARRREWERHAPPRSAHRWAPSPRRTARAPPSSWRTNGRLRSAAKRLSRRSNARGGARPRGEREKGEKRKIHTTETRNRWKCLRVGGQSGRVESARRAARQITAVTLMQQTSPKGVSSIGALRPLPRRPLLRVPFVGDSFLAGATPARGGAPTRARS